MPIFPIEHVDSYGTLEEFAKNDGSYAIYKVASEPDGEHTHYYLIREPEDEVEMKNNPQVYNSILVYGAVSADIANDKDKTPAESDILQGWQHNNNGLAYSKKGLHQEALIEFNKAISLNPNDGSLYFNAGCCYLSLKDYEKAIDYFNKAIEIESINPKTKLLAFQNRALAYRRIGRWEEAKLDDKKADAQKPYLLQNRIIKLWIGPAILAVAFMLFGLFYSLDPSNEFTLEVTKATFEYSSKGQLWIPTIEVSVNNTSFHTMSFVTVRAEFLDESGKPISNGSTYLNVMKGYPQRGIVTSDIGYTEYGAFKNFLNMKNNLGNKWKADIFVQTNGSSFIKVKTVVLEPPNGF